MITRGIHWAQQAFLCLLLQQLLLWLLLLLCAWLINDITLLLWAILDTGSRHRLCCVQGISSSSTWQRNPGAARPLASESF
jgi:hypothetical protein